jgi:hypothetical protein
MVQCRGIKADGAQCSYQGKVEYDGYCGIHKSQQRDSPVRTPKRGTSPERSSSPSPSTATQCRGVKADGERCSYQGKAEFDGYCGIHKNQQRESSVRTPERATSTERSSPPSSSTPLQCRGVKADGKRCSYQGKAEFDGYCGIHKNQQRESPVRTPERGASPERSSSPSPSTPPQCRGVKANGERCSYQGKVEFHGYCGIHKNQQIESPVRTPERATSPERSSSPSSSTPLQCRGVKADGERCSYQGKAEFDGYCGIHKNQQRESSVRTPERATSPERSSSPSSSTPPQCRGVKENGERCSYQGKAEFDGYCCIHKNQQSESPVRTPGTGDKIDSSDSTIMVMNLDGGNITQTFSDDALNIWLEAKVSRGKLPDLIGISELTGKRRFERLKQILERKGFYVIPSDIDGREKLVIASRKDRWNFEGTATRLFAISSNANTILAPDFRAFIFVRCVQNWSP